MCIVDVVILVVDVGVGVIVVDEVVVCILL